MIKYALNLLVPYIPVALSLLFYKQVCLPTINTWYYNAGVKQLPWVVKL